MPRCGLEAPQQIRHGQLLPGLAGDIQGNAAAVHHDRPVAQAQGGLDVAYAVEIEKPGSKTYESSPVTGDPFNLLKYILIMTAALILGVIAVVSWRKERKDGEKA